ncbi:MAG: hypothetical protein Q9162_002879 [Coniocarpon cinnabarinum]
MTPNPLHAPFRHPPSASWHTDHRNSAFIYIGGLDARLSEGDVIVIFSQYGQPNYLNLPRDKETGKPRGFAFLRYADQRSTDLAVDNLGGADVLGRKLRVDHCEYKVREGERVWDNTYGSEGEDDPEEMKGSGSENEGEKRPVLKEERELEKLIREHDEEDPLKNTTTTGVETAPIDLQRESADIPTSTEDEEATIDGHQSIADKEAIVGEQQSIGDEESAIDK